MKTLPRGGWGKPTDLYRKKSEGLHKKLPRFPHYLADGFQFIRVVAWRPNTQQKEESLYDDETMAIATDRDAGSRHRDEYGFDGLGPGALSDTVRWIDLGVHGDTLQRGYLSRMDRTRQQLKYEHDRRWRRCALRDAQRRLDLVVYWAGL
jgi:hypothetical protein